MRKPISWCGAVARVTMSAIVLCGLLLAVEPASANVMNTLLIGSSGTLAISLDDLVFNADSAAIGGGNLDVAAGTNLVFAGCASGVLGSAGCLALQEGITANN